MSPSRTLPLVSTAALALALTHCTTVTLEPAAPPAAPKPAVVSKPAPESKPHAVAKPVAPKKALEAPAPEKPAAPPEVAAVPLSLADFTDATGAPPSAGWVKEADGTIHLAGKGAGLLITKNDYSNFELEWEWKVGEGGNNGIKYWVNDFGKDGKHNWLGIEYQMIDDDKHADAHKGDNHNTASIYDIKGAATDQAVKPAGEWNTSKIVVKDGKIEHWLNGKLAVSADTSTAEWKAGIENSKFKKVEGFAPGKGRLMLTEHGDETWFRNLRLTPL